MFAKSKTKKNVRQKMKAKLTLATVLLAALLFTNFSYAEVNKTTTKANTYETIEQNRLIGLASDNEGVRVSAAFNLGEMKSEKAVIPLIKSLREGTSEEERIIAALSLIKIGDPRGAFMVARTAKYCDCARLSYFCEKFYQSYLNSKTGEEKKEIQKTWDEYASTN
jgi:hypothetical protein